MIKDNVNNGLQMATIAVSPEPTNTVTPTTPDTAEAPVAQSLTAETAELQAVVSKLTDHVQSISRTLSFSVEQVTGTTVIQVIDSETDELIRQIPNQEALEIALAIDGKDPGLLIKAMA